MTNPPPAHALTRSPAQALRWGGWAVALACLFLKAIVTFDPFPIWGTDPTRVAIPVSGLTPAASVALDLLILFAAGLAMIGEALAGFRIRRVPVLLWAIGAAGIAWHAVIRERSLDNTVQGLSWAGATAAGLAAWHLCRDERLRRVTLAAAIGIVGMFAAKGVLQIFVEHPSTVASFRENREAFLAAQGWTPGSTAARAFERRLTQAEASGWFGMANVFASFMAAGLVALLGWAVLAWRRVRDEDTERPFPSGLAGILSIGAVVATAGVWMAGSKGGVAAAALGLILLLTGGIASRVSRQPWGRRLAIGGGVLGIAIVALALSAIVARGLIGERIGDRSILFRWFYLQGAVRIFDSHPLAGTGPAGFKDAYMLHKPPLSPEDVASPHSILFDYAATLGIFGFAWAALLLSWVWGAGVRFARGIAAPDDATPTQPAPHPRPEAWFVGFVIILPTLAAAWVERVLNSPDSAIARLCGLAAWLAIAAAIVALARTGARWVWVAAAAALVLAAHGQIELTATWPGAAGLFMLILGAAAADDAAPRATDRRFGRSVLFALSGSLPAMCAIALAPFTVFPIARWERALVRAGDAALPAGEMHTRISGLVASGPAARAEAARIAHDLADQLGTTPPATPTEFEAAAHRLLMRCASQAIPHLAEAAAVYPSHLPTTEALTRLILAGASAQAAIGGPPDTDSVHTATAMAASFALRHPSAASLGFAGNTFSAAHDLLNQADLLDRAGQYWSHAADLDPHGPSFAFRLIGTMQKLGRSEAVRFWAAEALRRDNLQRLDELRRLTPHERVLADDILAAPRTP